MNKINLQRGLTLLILLAWIDIALTRMILSLGGSELNPVMNVAIHETWGVALKMGLTALIAGYLYFRKSDVGFKVANGLMMLVVIINTTTLSIQIILGGIT